MNSNLQLTTRQKAEQYTHGYLGHQQNGPKAIALYRQAVQEGDRQAMGDLAYFLLNGIFVERDAFQAVRLYERAIQGPQVDERVFYELATCYEHGEGCSPNLPRALVLYRRSASLGCRIAQRALNRLLSRVPH